MRASFFDDKDTRKYKTLKIKDGKNERWCAEALPFFFIMLIIIII